MYSASIVVLVFRSGCIGSARDSVGAKGWDRRRRMLALQMCG